MNKKRILPNMMAIVAMCFLFVGFNSHAQEKWTAPSSADNLVNPLKGDAGAAASGKRTYRMLCVICHGAKGKGDGMGGAGLTPKPTDFTDSDVQAQTDGALYWKLTEGRSPMASYKTALPEKKRWELINYIRTLKK
ncbi:MAG: cytochrome c [Allomuricauda sp.]|uniref:Cbb3-type cytochrome c oxidase subunit III n=1 Tax=Flagellimonas meridianipacifica TaxID=1080225 RepID=A0A2T0MEZ7_9FLAO|nr:cytochrome c [Allomuricauda pacifica]PRX56157.1 cbb3-type cytochrome c oxidase subunit III [Allomuricauda pacifica]